MPDHPSRDSPPPCPGILCLMVSAILITNVVMVLTMNSVAGIAAFISLVCQVAAVVLLARR